MQLVFRGNSAALLSDTNEMTPATSATALLEEYGKMPTPNLTGQASPSEQGDVVNQEVFWQRVLCSLIVVFLSFLS